MLFPLRPLVSGRYFFPEMMDYLRFCKEHKGLAKNSCIQIEIVVRRFDQFLHSAGLTAWNRLQSSPYRYLCPPGKLPTTSSGFNTLTHY